jgi:ubiquinol-cytochrome c reductase cytochrome c1 subunit
MKRILALLLLLPALGWAAGGAKTPLDRAPINLHDRLSLQRGAQLFVNHCLNCHSASVMRYGRLADLGLTEEQIRDNLLISAEKVGESMAGSMDSSVAKAAFGIVPPDLSLVGRSRGADWLYTYMRGFYRDPAARSGWNNVVFPNVAMPHVLWDAQGEQVLEVTERMDPNTGDVKRTQRLVLDRPGKLTRAEYDQQAADLVNFLAWMGEPAQATRKVWGILALFLLAGFLVLSMLLKSEYWKDVK